MCIPRDWGKSTVSCCAYNPWPGGLCSGDSGLIGSLPGLADGSWYPCLPACSVISRAPGLKLVVETLISSLKPIGNIVLICCAFFIIFGILGVQVRGLGRQ